MRWGKWYAVVLVANTVIDLSFGCNISENFRLMDSVPQADIEKYVFSHPNMEVLRRFDHSISGSQGCCIYFAGDLQGKLEGLQIAHIITLPSDTG